MKSKLLKLKLPIFTLLIRDVIPMNVRECIFFGVISTDHEMCLGVGAYIHRKDIVFDKTVFLKLCHEMICRIDIFLVIKSNHTSDWAANHAFLYNCYHHFEVMGAHILSEADGFVLYIAVDSTHAIREVRF